MSSLASAPTRATSEPAEATGLSRPRGRRALSDAVLAAVLTAGLGAIVFVATGGTDLGPNTWVEIALLAFGAGCAVALVLLPRHRSATADVWPIVAVALFAALAALTYLSIAWSVQPATSWVEANRTLAYLATFAGAATLARLIPGHWPAVIGAVGAAAVIVCGYALLAKVFPASLNAADQFGRLRVPFGYWNATGVMAALGLPVCLWAGTRPVSSGTRPAPWHVLRALTVPALVVLFTTLILSYSRGALLAAAVGLAIWFIFAPLRLRATLLLALGAVGGAVATGYALSRHAITHDGATLPARTAAGHSFGLVLLLVLVATAAVGVGAIRAMDRTRVADHLRRRIGIALLILVALVPVVAVAGLAASSRGLTGEISHVWNTVTSTNPGTAVGNNPSRLGALSNSRGLYWSEGLKVGEHAPLAGVGAGGFDTARTRYSTSPLRFAHAHSYLIETFADLGLIGVALSLALLVAWAAAVRRSIARAAFDDPERAGLITMLSVVVIFGVSSLIDWTWFVPGITVPALVCAGWLAGRGRLAAAPFPLAAAPLDAAPSGPSAVPTSTGGVARPAFTTAPTPALMPARLAGAVALAAALLIAGWFVWQPLRSADSVSAAIDAMTRGNARVALADARSAATSNPVSVDPLWELSAIYSALGDQTASRQELLKAVQTQPSNPQTWQQLAAFDLQAHNVRQLVLAELLIAYRLDPTSQLTRQLINQVHGQRG